MATGEIADSVREIASFRTKIKDIGSKVRMMKMTIAMALTMMKPAVVMVMMEYDFLRWDFLTFTDAEVEEMFTMIFLLRASAR